MVQRNLSDRILKKLNKPKYQDVDIETEELRNDAVSDNEMNGSDDDEGDDQREQEEAAKRRHYVDVGKSKIKKTTINMGEKYVGSKVDRSELFGSKNNEDGNEENEEEESAEESVNEDEVEDDNEEERSENELEEEEENILGDVTDSENEETEEEDKEEDNSDQSVINEFTNEDEEESEDEDEVFKRSQISKIIQQEKEQVLSRASNTAKSDALKGYTIIRQGSQFDKILDSRIKIQKAMISSNQLPVDKKSLEDHKTGETNNLIDDVENKALDLLEKLLSARKLSLIKGGLVKNKIKIKSKKRSLDEYLKLNSELDTLEHPLRKTILTKWSNRVQSASGLGALNQGKFKVLNQSIWNQVNNELNDIDRLVKKTHVNRRGVNPLGYAEGKEEVRDDDEEEEHDDKGGFSNIDKSLQTNENIFDDDDFYRLLLNDMINKKLDQKQANSQAILMLSKNKLQKNYDRMATKGRKLKYTVQDSIVQFEMPKRQRFEWDDDQIDELFAGLMGMKVEMNESDGGDDDGAASEHEDMGTFKESGIKLFG